MPTLTHAVPHRADRTAVLSGTRRLASCLVAASLLTACASTPLPVWVPATMRPAPSVAAPAVSASQALPLPAPSSGVQVFPVPAPVLGAESLATTLNTPASPYNAAVAARFPAPGVGYSTPGLQPGRSSFSTGPEVSSWLREQALAASRVAGVPPVTAAVVSVGRSQRGEPLEALVLTRAPGVSAASLLATGRPTMLLLAQQGADAPAATEALLVLANELARGLLRPTLEKINVMLVPRFNPDAAVGAFASPALLPSTPLNAGPANRTDHLALAAPESQALATLIRDYRPAVVVDVREYDVGGPNGSLFFNKFDAVPKFDVQFQYATTANTPELLTRASEEWFRRPLAAALKQQGLSMEWVHTTSGDMADKRVSMGGTQPDRLRNTVALKNSIGLQVESRGAGLGREHLQRRVHSQVTALSSVLASTAQRSSDLGQLRPFFDREVSGLACTGQVVVQAVPVAAQYDLLTLDAATGSDKTLTVDWDSALALNRLSVRARPCGYWVSSTAVAAVDRLLLHGVKVLQVADAGALLADSYRQTVRADGSANANVNATPAVSLTRGLVDVPRGSYYVPLNQPLAHVVIAALEPDTPFSFLSQRVLSNLPDVARVMAPPAVKLQDLP